MESLKREAVLRQGRRWYGMTVRLREGESQEALLKRFRKKVTEGGILTVVRRRRWFVSKSEQRRIRKAKAIRRARQRRRRFERE